VMLGVAACLCVLLLTTSVPGTERFQGDDVSVGDSNRSRLTLYEESVEYIGERPIVGNGFDLVRGSHNLTLQLLLAGGLIALVGYLTVFFGYLSIGWKLRPRVPDWLSGDSVGLTLSLAAFLLAGVFSNDVYARYLYIPAGLLLSMSLVYEREAGKRLPRSEVG
jgi:O-antigen ligase